MNMKQKIKKSSAALAVILGLSLPASTLGFAAIFTDTLSFSDLTHSTLGYAYKDIPDSAGFFWEHDIRDQLRGQLLQEIKLLSAELSLSYAKTEGNESWFLKNLGALPVTGESPLTKTFSLDALLLSELQSQGMILIHPMESSTGRDSLRLVSSSLSGSYERSSNQTPIPEPVTGLLILIGTLIHLGGRKYWR